MVVVVDGYVVALGVSRGAQIKVGMVIVDHSVCDEVKQGIVEFKQSRSDR